MEEKEEEEKEESAGRGRRVRDKLTSPCPFPAKENKELGKTRGKLR